MSHKEVDPINFAFMVKELAQLKENIQNLWEAINETNDRVLELENNQDVLLIDEEVKQEKLNDEKAQRQLGL